MKVAISRIKSKSSDKTIPRAPFSFQQSQHLQLNSYIDPFLQGLLKQRNVLTYYYISKISRLISFYARHIADLIFSRMLEKTNIEIITNLALKKFSKKNLSLSALECGLAISGGAI